MKLIEMQSSTGAEFVSVHPSRIQSYENRGWTRVDPVSVEKPKPKPKPEVVNG